MKKTVIFMILSIIMILGGCFGSDSSDSNTGTLKMSIADAPVNSAENVYVVISKVEVHNVDEDIWLSLNEFTGEDYPFGGLKLDLLTLRFDTELLGEEDIPVGTYDQIRLYLAAKNEDAITTDQSNSYIVYTDENGVSQTEDIFIPSGEQSGLKINHEFTIESDTVKRLLLDNDVSELLNQAGKSGKIILRPTAIQVIDETISGDIEGVVLADTDGDHSYEAVTDYDVVITVSDQDGNVVKSTIATVEETTEDGTIRPAGSFRLRGLLPGIYRISAKVYDEEHSYYLFSTVGYTEITVNSNEIEKTLIDSPLHLEAID